MFDCEFDEISIVNFVDIVCNLISQFVGVNVVLQYVQGYGGGLQDFKEVIIGDGCGDVVRQQYQIVVVFY